MVFQLALSLAVAGLPSPLLPTPGQVVIPARDGHLAIAHGVLTGPQQGELTDAAKAFVLSRRDELGLPLDSSLGTPLALGTRFGGTVHLPQLVGGVELHGASAVVTFDQARRVVRLASSLKSYRRAVVTPVITGVQAVQLAAQQVDRALAPKNGVPYGGFMPRAFMVGDEAHAGFLVYVPTAKLGENWHAAVDATTGEVLWTQNRVHHANTGSVYPVNPGTGAVTAANTAQVELQHLPADAGLLNGEAMEAWGCCPTANCDADAGAPQKRGLGQLQAFSMGQVVLIDYDVAICDRQQTATSAQPSGNFVYTPVDPPTTVSPTIASRADYDSFTEVQGYYHANKTYDVLRELSGLAPSMGGSFSPFTLRDNRAGRKTAVWVNVSDADFENGELVGDKYVSNEMSRVDNAMFLPRENMQYIALPEHAFNSDALVLYQGNTADYAYDAPVLWHEFGHGAIYSTANWDTVVTIDDRSANNESSALHEGMADVFAFMVGNDSRIGTYVSVHQNPSRPFLRDANNSFKCPDVLWGESHQDSEHFVAAIWEARSGLFLGSDQGKTFDSAVYAAVVSFPKNVGFESGAAIIASAVGLAFPGMDAEAKMKAIFDARGITQCSKVLDITTDREPRLYYGIAGTAFADLSNGSVVPGPFQFKFHVPAGAKSVSVRYQGFGGGGGGGGTPTSRLLAKVNAPITFTRTGNTLTNDADISAGITGSQGVFTGSANLDVPCGGDLHFTLGNASQRDRQAYNLEFDFVPADSCPEPPPDAGMPDAGEPQPTLLDKAPDTLGDVNQGCGCSGSPALSLLGLGALALLRRRRSL